jgi:hypothetical protein
MPSDTWRRSKQKRWPGVTPDSAFWRLSRSSRNSVAFLNMVADRLRSAVFVILFLCQWGARRELYGSRHPNLRGQF